MYDVKPKPVEAVTVSRRVVALMPSISPTEKAKSAVTGMVVPVCTSCQLTETMPPVVLPLTKMAGLPLTAEKVTLSSTSKLATAVMVAIKSSAPV